MDLKEIAIDTRNWVDSASDAGYWRALVNATGTPSGKRPLGWPRWEDNIRMDLKEIAINTRNWIDSGQDMDYRIAFVYSALSLRVS